MSHEILSEASLENILALLTRRIGIELPSLLKEVCADLENERILESIKNKVGTRLDEPEETISFTRFVRERIRILKAQKRIRTASNYKTALNSLSRYLESRDIPFKALSSDTMVAFQKWLEGGQVNMNTVSCYMRSLRSVYNKAVEAGYTKQKEPFKQVYTKISQTSKRAISAESLRSLQLLRLREDECPAFVRDLFLFCFYTRGMSFIDMAFLRKNQIRNGYILYKRHKTNQEIRIKVERCIQEIVDRYHLNTSPYVFPILTISGLTSLDNQYRSKECYYNRVLKKLGRKANVEIPLSFYVARHTWASLAFQHRVELEIISKALGHTSTKTTLIYIKSIENDVAVNEANSELIDKIFKDPGTNDLVIMEV